MKRFVFSLVLTLPFLAASAQITLSGGKNGFPLVGSKGPATIFYDKNDALVVERSAMMLSQDISDVTGQAFNPASPSMEEMKGLFVEDNGIVAIPAEYFVRKTENQATKMTVIDNLGCEGKVVQMGNPVMPRQNSRAHDVPCLDYEFYTWQQGMVDVYTYVLRAGQ